MPSLSEMRANPPKSRLERDFDIVLDATLMRRVADLTRQAQALSASKSQADRAKYQQTIAELESLAPDVEAKSGTLRLRANLSSGEWRRFVDENPPRPEGTIGHDRDRQRTAGMVNADALIDALDRFAAEWDGDSLEGDDFNRLLRDNIPPGDLVDMAEAVVLMYETSPDFGQWRSALPAALQRLRDFAVPETSVSPRSDSTAGSPELSSEVTTVTETAAT